MATMNLKTFRAPSMAQALSEVKKDLGKDAVILHTRSYKVGAVMGIGGKQVIEITAADQVSARGPSIRATRPAAQSAFIPGTFPSLDGGGTAVIERPPPEQAPEPAGPVVMTKPVKVEDVAPRKSGGGNVPAAAPARPASLATKAVLAPTTNEAVASLQSELASIRRLV
jgi:flagellar biosynthesis GTPase FlhF